MSFSETTKDRRPSALDSEEHFNMDHMAAIELQHFATIDHAVHASIAAQLQTGTYKYTPGFSQSMYLFRNILQVD